MLIIFLNKICCKVSMELFDKINSYRVKHDLEEFEFKEELKEVAQEQADYMCKINKLTHANQDLIPLKQRIRDKGIDMVMKAGENIAKSDSEAYESIAKLWMKNEGHKNNILGNYTHSAIATCKTPDDIIYWVEVFANLSDQQGYKNYKNNSISKNKLYLIIKDKLKKMNNENLTEDDLLSSLNEKSNKNDKNKKDKENTLKDGKNKNNNLDKENVKNDKENEIIKEIEDFIPKALEKFKNEILNSMKNNTVNPNTELINSSLPNDTLTINFNTIPNSSSDQLKDLKTALVNVKDNSSINIPMFDNNHTNHTLNDNTLNDTSTLNGKNTLNTNTLNKNNNQINNTKSINELNNVTTNKTTEPTIDMKDDKHLIKLIEEVIESNKYNLTVVDKKKDDKEKNIEIAEPL
ncbi:hypothetical protein A0H76_2378 [Hepatospora eriocheir]|uniref:SCP domain-containing protein n=1 Tax=Hepatospora eriocheir TaxID=1081669 RepID=A0A1X0QLC4_9MICR|nr:hypothetical protein A0H76_2378 [Hepatospora eriocheir]